MQRLLLKPIIAFGLAVFIIAHIGFYQKYIALFPAFEKVSNVTHFHATLMFLWLALLVAQPILILNHKVALHKFIGRLTYIVAPLLLLSMLLITKQKYLRNTNTLTSVEQYANLAIQIPDFFAFGILYSLAIYYRKKTDWHARFMIATVFPIMGAAIFRILNRNFDIPRFVALDIIAFTADIICLIFMLADIKRKKYQPYLVALTILLLEHLAWALRYTKAWQRFAKFLVDSFIA